MSIKVLWLIAARSGSKSIPDKNISIIGNLPLLAYRIISANKTEYNNEIWISTDSIAYAELAKEYGAKVPFIRPIELAHDDSSSIDVVLHAMHYSKINGYKFDFIGLLEPTSPFITTAQLNEAIKVLINEPSADSIVAVRESRPNTIFIQDDSRYLEQIALAIENIKLLGRQKFNKQITPSGGFYISRWNKFLQNKTFYTNKTLGLLVDEISGLEIDEPLDFLFAQYIIEKNKFINNV